MIEIVGLGIVAGILTTVAGMGGGLLLIVSLGALHGPHFALAVTTPALLVSNCHRAFLFRSSIDRGVARAFAVGAIPGTILAGYAVPSVPAIVLRIVLVAATLLALARALKLLSLKPRPSAIIAGGVGVGVLTATAGGAGVLTGPLLQSAGLRGAPYIGTIALCAVALHLGRMLGYGAGGMFSADHVVPMAVLAAALVAGNFAGRRLRAEVDTRTETLVEISALVLCTAVGVMTVGR
jgi:hypothetical protein